MNRDYIEIEAKYKLECDIAVIEEYLKKKGFRIKAEVLERDTYYNHPCRDFRDTDEALRLRKRTIKKTLKTSIVLTYKGPRKVLGEGVKSRVEVEVEVASYESMHKLLVSLGFTDTISYVKSRRIYAGNNAEITLDHLYGVGYFVEIETHNQQLINDIYGELEKCLEPVDKTYLEICLESGGCIDERVY